MIYIAGPFFNEEQLTLIKQIEEYLEISNIDFFSPRSAGSLKDMSDADKKKKFDDIYDSNIHNMYVAQTMIAVIDDYDPGTVFEMGYFTRLKSEFPDKRLITISNKNYGINIMLKNAINYHVTDVADLLEAIVSSEDNDHDFGEVE